MQEQRIGQFSISTDVVLDHQEAARLVLRDVVILSAQHIPWNREFIYVGMHPSFDVHQVGSNPPRYTAVIHIDTGDGDSESGRTITSVEWKKFDEMRI